MSFHFGFPDVFILKGFVWRPNGSPEVRLETIQLSIFPCAIKMSRLPPSDRDGQNFQVFFPTKWRFDSKCVACLLVGALEWLQTVEPTGGGAPASEIAIVIITGLERKRCFAKNDLYIEITWQENFICSTSCWPHSAVGRIPIACLVKNCLNNLFHLRLFILHFVFHLVGMDFDQSHINMRGHEMAVDELWAQISEMLSEMPATWYRWSSVTAPPPFLLLKCSKKTY